MDYDGGQYSAYSYVSNDPVNVTDSYGLWTLSGTIAVGLGVRFSIGINSGQASGSAQIGVGLKGSVDADFKNEEPAEYSGVGADYSAAAEVKAGPFAGIGTDVEWKNSRGPTSSADASLGPVSFGTKGFALGHSIGPKFELGFRKIGLGAGAFAGVGLEFTAKKPKEFECQPFLKPIPAPAPALN